MYLHLQFLSDNRDCKVCLNCIKSCGHNSAQFNIRVPGAEIASLRETTLAGPVISIILSGLLVAEIFSRLDISQVNLLYIFTISVFCAISLNLVSNYLTASIQGNTVVENVKSYGYTLLPLVLFGHIALKFMEVFVSMKGSLVLFGIYRLYYNLTTIIQLLLVIIGLFLSEYLIFKIVQRRISIEKRFRTFIIQGMGPVVLAVIYISLFFKGIQTALT